MTEYLTAKVSVSLELQLANCWGIAGCRYFGYVQSLSYFADRVVTDVRNAGDVERSSEGILWMAHQIGK